MARGERSSLFERLSESAYRDLMSGELPRAPRTMRSEVRLVRCDNCREWLTERSIAERQCRACGAVVTK